MRLCGVLSLLVIGCGGSGVVAPGRTGDAIVDACLHWTACTTPPQLALHLAFPDCATFSQGKYLPWRAPVTLTPAQRDCMAAAGLDCNAALACVSTPAACDKPTWSCDGDTMTYCDVFAGPRAVTRDCAAEGLHCVMLGGEHLRHDRMMEHVILLGSSRQDRRLLPRGPKSGCDTKITPGFGT